MRSRIQTVSDVITEGLIYFMVVFAPWALGTTQPWSIWTINLAGYLLGAVLTIKVTDRWRKRKRLSVGDIRHKLPVFLAALTILILGYCLVSALNARATYDAETRQFLYHQCHNWLPHSYDSHRSWFVFWNYLALALSFWAIRDWLLGPGKANDSGQEARLRCQKGLPKRWQRLLWVLCLNGALLGAECLVQRIEGTSRLLGLVEPRIHKTSNSQFGPYAYRSNAAQYFNLIWPACLGCWWMLHRARAGSAWRRGQSGPRAYGVILPCVMLMAACAIASLSRGGALIAVGQMVAASIILLLARAGPSRFGGWALGVSGIFVLAVLLSVFFEGTSLYKRFGALLADPTAGRAEIYRQAWLMARDFSLWGSGPKTFSPLYQLYFSSVDGFWPAQVHNDWLETWITFGGVGFSLIVLALMLVFWRYFGAGGVVTPWPFTALLWLGLIGCLCFGAVDFPFQIASILFSFLLLCAMASCVSRRA